MQEKIIAGAKFLLAAIVAAGGIALAFGFNLDVESLKAAVMSAETRLLAGAASVAAFMPNIPAAWKVLIGDGTLEEKINALAQLALAAIVAVGGICAAFGVTLDIEAMKALAANWQTRALSAVAAIATFTPSIPTLLGSMFGGNTKPVEE